MKEKKNSYNTCAMKLFPIFTMARWQIKINKKNWEAKMKKNKTWKKLNEEDANLNSESVQRSLK